VSNGLRLAAWKNYKCGSAEEVEAVACVGLMMAHRHISQPVVVVGGAKELASRNMENTM
jgi:hypothetical protein